MSFDAGMRAAAIGSIIVILVIENCSPHIVDVRTVEKPPDRMTQIAMRDHAGSLGTGDSRESPCVCSVAMQRVISSLICRRRSFSPRRIRLQGAGRFSSDAIFAFTS